MEKCLAFVVFARHGFGSFLVNLQLERRISLPPRLLKQEDNSHISPAEYLLLALEELSPTFVKLGQQMSNSTIILSSRNSWALLCSLV
jgi:predicted unusual protein kinase regulating ubiquinone biosynthesis (AarF/ABC1/UbiB family)